MNDKIKGIAADMGITQIGFVRAEIFSDAGKMLDKDVVMMNCTLQERINPFIEYEWVKSFAVCLLPYYIGGEKARISRYAWGEDYHRVMTRYLSPIAEYLKKKGFKAEILCDNHNLNDRYLACKAGLGFIGRNGFLINKRYGTYTFIGSVATSAYLKESIPSEGACMGCGRCERLCPGGAISENGIDGKKCVSYLTQKKGELSREEIKKIKKSGYIWGCDICQEVCPHNRYAEKTNISEFKMNIINNLSIKKDISNKEFKRNYSERAFSWRGKQPILRNINIYSDENL